MHEAQEQVGLAWWQPEQWDRLKEISENRDELDDTYEDWRKNAAKAIREIESTGIVVKKVRIDLEDFLAWCHENEIPLSAEARSKYAAYVLERRNE